MKTFTQNGDVIAVATPAGGVGSGDALLVGSLFGIATSDAAVGNTVEIATTGAYNLPKDAATVIDVGDRVAWDDTTKEIALPGVGLYPVGVAAVAAGNGATTVTVRLDGIGTEAA
jgi:predicted RecA/RadA family phage recombinase